MSFPAQMSFSSALKPRSVPSTYQRQEWFPMGSNSFSPQSSRTISIPIASTEMLDTSRSWLVADVSATVGAGAGADAYLTSFYNLIQRVTLRSSSGAILEDINDFSTVVQHWINHLVPPHIIGGQLTQAGFPSNQAGLVGASYGPTTTANMTVFPQNATTTRTFTAPIPLVGLLNLTSGRHNEGNGLFLPLALMGQGIIIDIVLKDNVNDMLEGLTATPASVTSLTVSNVRYSGCVVKFDQSVYAELRNAVMQSGGKLFISSDSYQTQIFAFNQAVKQMTLSWRGRSLKGIAYIPRTLAQIGSNTLLNYPSKYDNATNIYIVAGGLRLPSAGTINTVAEVQANAEAFFGKPMAGPAGCRQAFESDNAQFANAGLVGGFLFAYDLEAYRSDVEAGADLTGNIQYVINVQTSTVENTIYTAVMHYDMVAIVDVAQGGQVSVSY